MADSDGKWTYDDGYTLINTVGGDCHHAQLKDFQRINELFVGGMFPVIQFDDVFGAMVSVRTDRIESIEQQTADSLDEIARVNTYAENRQKSSKPSWLDS